MEQVTVEYKVFQFNELDPKVQQNVLDKHREWNTSYCDWFQFVVEDYKLELSCIGFNDAEIYFSGFSSQGDGACFDCKSFDPDRLIQALEDRIDSKRFSKYKRIIKKLDLGYHIDTINHHYSHENTRRFRISESFFLASNPERYNRVNQLVNDFEKDIEDLRKDLCHKIYNSLEQEYDYIISDEAIKESFEAGDVRFLENGKIFSEI
jgi:hypothetical protein